MMARTRSTVIGPCSVRIGKRLRLLSARLPHVTTSRTETVARVGKQKSRIADAVIPWSIAVVQTWFRYAAGANERPGASALRVWCEVPGAPCIVLNAGLGWGLVASRMCRIGR